MDAVILTLCSALSATAYPASAELEKQVQAIFAVVDTESKAGASRAPIQKQLKALAPDKGDDYRLQYAFVIALIHERQYTDALREASAITKSRPTYLPAQRSRAWLFLSQKKYAEALPILDTIARLIPSQAADDPVEESYIETAQFLGTAMGFLEGPGESLVKEPVRVQYKTRIEGRLEGKRRAAFDAQVKAVADLFADIKQQGDRNFAKENERQTQSLQKVRESQTKLTDARSQSAAQQAELAKQLRANWDTLQKEFSTIRQNYAELTAQTLNMQNQRTQAASQLYALENPTKDKDGNIPQSARDAYNRLSPQLTQKINALDGQLTRASVSMQGMVERGIAVENQLTQLVSAGQAVGETFAMQEMSFRDEAKTLAAREARTKRKAPKVSKPGERSRLYSTYDEFAYELEKQRLLESLAEQ